MDPDLARLQRLMRLATGDEKHDASASSTLIPLWVLYDRIMRYDPAAPRAETRDRFVLSKGHGPLALYAILADKGFFPAEVLATFARRGSRLGAHPDRMLVPGVETSTGSLGHGLPLAVGMALGLRLKRSDRRVFVLIGDGECNEGSIWEAALLAGALRLAQLTGLAINNHSSSLDLGDLAAKFAAFGWAAQTVDGRDPAQVEAALRRPADARPSMIVCDIRA